MKTPILDAFIYRAPPSSVFNIKLIHVLHDTEANVERRQVSSQWSEAGAGK